MARIFIITSRQKHNDSGTVTALIIFFLSLMQCCIVFAHCCVHLLIPLGGLRYVELPGALPTPVSHGSVIIGIIRGDVFRFIKSCKQQYDLIFADPPYALPTLPTIPQLILGKGMLRPGGLLVFEHGKHNDFSDVPGFIEHRAYGKVKKVLVK